jgi:hypothetical protein
VLDKHLALLDRVLLDCVARQKFPVQHAFILAPAMKLPGFSVDSGTSK